MDEESQRLYNEESISLLKDIKKRLGKLERNVNVEAPIVNVEPTPVVVDKHEVILDTSDIKLLAEAVSKRLNEKQTVIVANPTKSVDSVSIKNFGVITTLLNKLLKKKTEITVKAPIVNTPDIRGFDPKQYIPVRLTDGTQFYNVAPPITAGRTSKPFSDYLFYGSLKNDGGYDYIGQENGDGKWVIERRNRTTGIMEFAIGKGSVETAWSDRANHTYRKLSEVI